VVNYGSVQDYRGTGEKDVTLGWVNFFFLFQLNAHTLNIYNICVFTILYEFSWNKKKKFSARMH